MANFDHNGWLITIIFGGQFGSEYAVGVEDLRDADCKSLFKGLYAEGGVEGKGNLPGEDVPAVPVHDRRKIDEALLHGDVSNVRAKDLVGPRNVQAL